MLKAFIVVAAFIAVTTPAMRSEMLERGSAITVTVGRNVIETMQNEVSEAERLEVLQTTPPQTP